MTETALAEGRQPETGRAPSPVEEDPLWRRLSRYRFDPAETELPFSARLARENGWDATQAFRVMDEYLKFVYLALRAGHPVTPSDAVDQAWHLHLIHSEEYWRHFCPEVLQQELHHAPTRGGAAERAKFRDWYANTLAAYRTTFAAAPPADIWPAPDSRFADAVQFRRVNMRDQADNRLLLRANLVKDTAIGLGLLGLFYAMFGNLDGPGWLALLVILVLFVFLAMDMRKLSRGLKDRRKRLKTGDFDNDASSDIGCSSGCGGGCGGS